MPVNSCHPDIVSATARWRIVRDCIEGTQAVKDASTDYLPMLGSQEDDPHAYAAYKKRALYFNAVNRTHDAVLGFLFRKPPIIELGPSEVPVIPEDEQENIDLAGNSITEYARLVGDDVASIGRAGTLIDWSMDDGMGRPRFTFYAAERIINWRAAFKRGKYIVTLLVLEEIVEQESADEYQKPDTVQYRVIRLTDEGVTVEVQTGGRQPSRAAAIETHGGQADASWEIIEQFQMTRRGQPLLEIPFVFHNADHIGPGVGISPLYDLACVNISHYQTSADLENGRHICGVPTPYAFGLTGDGGEPVPASKLYLGGPAWVSDNSAAQVGFLEFTGQGLASLEKAHDQKIQMMAAIGARMMEPKSGDAEAFETVALRATAETSALASMAMYLSRTMTDCLRWYVWWSSGVASIEDIRDVSFSVNRDFMASRMQPAEIQAMLQMVEAGRMSYETFFFNLQRADIMPPGRTMEQEMDAIETTLTDMPRPAPTLTAPQPEPEEADEDEQEEEPAPPPRPPAKKAARKRANTA
jgi:hypothetical protein